MYGLACLVLLKHEHTGAFRKLGVVLNDYCRRQPIDHFVDENLIGGEFLVSMNGNTHLSAGHQCSHLLQSLSHRLGPSVIV